MSERLEALGKDITALEKDNQALMAAAAALRQKKHGLKKRLDALYDELDTLTALARAGKTLDAKGQIVKAQPIASGESVGTPGAGKGK